VRNTAGAAGRQIRASRGRYPTRLGGLGGGGWDGPLSLDDADRVARERVADGSDLMGGRRWRYLGTGDVDTGQCAIGDGSALLEALDADGRFPDSLQIDPPAGCS
jgi:hypothetical protein